jgi:hypothetical protein
MEQYDGTNGAQARNMDAPWFWLNKAAVTLIRDKLGQTGFYDRVFKVYVALTELSSDKGNKQTFAAGRALVAHKAAVSTSTVDRALKCLKKIKLVAIKRRRVKGKTEQLENEYTLLAVPIHDDEKLDEVSSPVTPPYRHGCDDTPIVTGDAVVEERNKVKESTRGSRIHVAAGDVVPTESVDSKTEERIARDADAHDAVTADASNERTTSAARRPCSRRHRLISEEDWSGFQKKNIEFAFKSGTKRTNATRSFGLSTSTRRI